MAEERRDRVEALFDQAADLPPERAAGPAGRRLRRTTPASAPRSRGCWPTTPGCAPARTRRTSWTAPWSAPRADDRPAPRARRGRPRCRRGSAATASCACSARAAWARSTRPSRTTRAAPSPSRSSAPAWSRRALLKRFAHEAQILGRLHHPGIAQIYEAGVAEDGQPFFAMEFIRGVPLDEYARRHGLDAAGPPGAAGAGVRRGAARPRARRHPPRPQARQHPGGRDRPAQGARLRRGPRHRRRPADRRRPAPRPGS